MIRLYCFESRFNHLCYKTCFGYWFSQTSAPVSSASFWLWGCRRANFPWANFEAVNIARIHLLHLLDWCCLTLYSKAISTTIKLPRSFPWIYHFSLERKRPYFEKYLANAIAYEIIPMLLIHDSDLNFDSLDCYDSSNHMIGADHSHHSLHIWPQWKPLSLGSSYETLSNWSVERTFWSFKTNPGLLWLMATSHFTNICSSRHLDFESANFDLHWSLNGCILERKSEIKHVDSEAIRRRYLVLTELLDSYFFMDVLQDSFNIWQSFRVVTCNLKFSANSFEIH